MMITVRLIAETDDATLRTVSIDDSFECFGLEDEFREDKISGETRIPAGCYKVGVRTEGGFHNRYTRKFGSFHKGMLQVMNVPGFEYILIHIGNTDEDTAGCLLVGAGANAIGELLVTSSLVAYKALYAKVIEAAANDDLWIEYIDEVA